MGRGLRIGHTVGPLLGNHGSDFDLEAAGTTPIGCAITTQALGSSIVIACLGRLIDFGAPTDNKGNTYSLLESSGYHGGLWSGYGMELYGKADAAGGSSHTMQFAKTGNAADEASFLAAEVKGGTVIQDSSIVTRAGAGDGVAYTSASVDTTGPALLIALWAGDGGVGVASQTVVQEAGWEMIESLFLTNTAYIQAAMAAKRVSGAGTYTCDWAPVASQGAILGLVAVQV